MKAMRTTAEQATANISCLEATDTFDRHSHPNMMRYQISLAFPLSHSPDNMTLLVISKTSRRDARRLSELNSPNGTPNSARPTGVAPSLGKVHQRRKPSGKGKSATTGQNVGDQLWAWTNQHTPKSKRRSPIHSALTTTGHVWNSRQSQSGRGIVDTYRGSQGFLSDEFRPGY